MDLTTEYLIIVEKKASEAFYNLCETNAEFNRLLEKDSSISIDGEFIRYKSKDNYKYQVKTGEVEGKEQRFFHIKVSFNGDEKDLDEYTSLLRSLRSIIIRNGGYLEILKDDVSLHYSEKSYPFIHNIENIMRKLITYFMLTNVGKEWVEVALPSVVKEAINRNRRKQQGTTLHQADFIHLGDFLFRAYQTKNVSELYEVLDKADKPEDLNLDHLREFKARSNWERYFSNVVNCQNEYLEKKWSELYELRCSVAHNAIVGKSDYERIKTLCTEVGGHLQKAIENLDQVHVPEVERGQLAENVVRSISPYTEEFVQVWRVFNETLTKIVTERGLGAPESAINALQSLYKNSNIEKPLFDEGLELIGFAHQLIHDSRSVYSDSDVVHQTNRIEAFIRALTGGWKEEVVNALQALGGEAHLEDIYTYIEKNTLRRLPSTWDSAVRKTLQLYSSDVISFKGGEDLFERLGEGRWRLRGFVKKK